MKKIFSLAAAMLAALSINAQTAIGCAEAAALMPAEHNQETEGVYAVTGYVTNTNGTVSPSRTDATIMQQTFWMDDEKGSVKTLQGYWCNLPDDKALNVGDKITVTGKIMNYNGTPEIKNGDVVVLERVEVRVDTIPVNVCEAVEEGSALNPGDYTADVFIVTGVLGGQDSKNNYEQHTFFMYCEEDGGSFEAYNCLGETGLTLALGDTVKVTGKLYNYNGQVEVSNGSVELIARGSVVIDTIDVTVAEAILVGMALEPNATTTDVYAVTGFVDSIAIAYSEQYNNISFYLTDDMNEPAYDFEAFRVSVTAEQAAVLGVGAKVKVTAPLKRYYKAATETADEIDLVETDAGGALEIISEAAVETTTSNAKALKRLVNGELIIEHNNATYNAQGILK